MGHSNQALSHQADLLTSLRRELVCKSCLVCASRSLSSVWACCGQTRHPKDAGGVLLPRHTPILMSSFGPVLLLRQGVMGEQEVISPATPTVTSPKKQGSWFSRSTSKLPTPRTPSTSGSHGFFHHRTPLTHSPEEENAALEALKARIRQDAEEWHFWLE